MTHRHRWRRQPGNDGMSLVWVPDSDLVKTSRQTGRQDTGEDTPGMATPLADANQRADAADKRTDVALVLADRLTAQLADAAERIEQAEGRADAAHQRADRAELRADQAEDRARQAQAAAESLRQADEARKAGGRWARLRAAWRGD